MCCLFTTLVLLGPRIGGVLWWIFQPIRWEVTFNNSFIWPILGLLFLPWTTIMYVSVGFNGVTGFDWFWLLLAFLVDLGSYGGGAYGNRDRVPGYGR
jgi:hypothetical protein